MVSISGIIIVIFFAFLNVVAADFGPDNGFDNASVVMPDAPAIDSAHSVYAPFDSASTTGGIVAKNTDRKCNVDCEAIKFTGLRVISQAEGGYFNGFPDCAVGSMPRRKATIR